MTTSLDFTVFETNDCRTLGVIDTSIYADGQTISAPKLLIWTPGNLNSVQIGFLARKSNVINSNNLGLTCATDATGLTNIPDGIYKVQYTMKPSFSVEKTFMRTCRLQCRFDIALLKLDILSCDQDKKKQTINKLREIEFLIMGSKAATNVCNYTLANELYQRADKELDALDINNC